MRAFIAVDISKDVLTEIENRVNEWRSRLPGARWVRPRNLHLTLRFLGEATEETLAKLSESLTDIAGGSSPFRMNFDGVGFFPSSRKPRIFWAGVSEPPSILLELQKQLEAASRKHGFEGEKRRFSPHLTLARFRTARPSPDYELLTREHGRHSFGSSKVEEVILYQSILKPEGAEYTVLRRFRLGAS